jgi:hypothetical protein
MNTIKKTFYRKDFMATFNNTNNYFSFTGSFNGSSGAVGNKIAEFDPEFSLFEQMHLSNSTTGEPMYAVENGQFHFKQGGKLENLAKFWRTSPEELAQLILTNEDYQIYKSSLTPKQILRIEKFINKMPEELSYMDLFPLTIADISKKSAQIMLINNPSIWTDSVITKLKDSNAKKPIAPRTILSEKLVKAGIIFYNFNNITFRQKDKMTIDPVILLNLIPSLAKPHSQTQFGYPVDILDTNKFIPLCLKNEETKIFKSFAKQMKEKWLNDVEQVIKLSETIPERTSTYSEPTEYTDIEERQLALAKFVNCDVACIEKDEYNEGVYHINGKSYAVLNNEEANNELKSEITDSLWAFNAKFLSNYMPLKEKTILQMQSENENINSAFVELVGNKLEQLCLDATKSDGRGNFLNRDDGKEYIQEYNNTKYYIYTDLIPNTLTKQVKQSLKI